MKPTILLCVIMFSGCSTITSAWNYGAAANDKAVDSALAVLCNGASSGAINREFGLSSERARARRTLCGLGDI